MFSLLIWSVLNNADTNIELFALRFVLSKNSIM